MSKCEINIEFDRDNRLYRGGETVGGTVRIRVNEDINCDGVTLTHFWKTHGRGNTDRGEKHEQQLAPRRQLLRGETLSFPFSFSAEREPVSYHGHYVNIDHYVRVDVDIPWAFDPKAEEEYLVLPGKPPERLGNQPHAGIAVKASSGIGRAIGWVVVLVVIVALGFFMLVLVPILLLVAFGFWIVSTLIKGRLGDVELIAPKATVAPGETWPVELRFTPRKTFQVNQIVVKLMCQESATSGSGTNSTTHRHTVLEQTHVLHPADTIMRGKPFYRQTAITLPETDAFTFSSSDNHVKWWAEVRIDMPGFPDWSQKQDLQMVPREFLHPAPVEVKQIAKWK